MGQKILITSPTTQNKRFLHFTIICLAINVLVGVKQLKSNTAGRQLKNVRKLADRKNILTFQTICFSEVRISRKKIGSGSFYFNYGLLVSFFLNLPNLEKNDSLDNEVDVKVIHVFLDLFYFAFD